MTYYNDYGDSLSLDTAVDFGDPGFLFIWDVPFDPTADAGCLEADAGVTSPYLAEINNHAVEQNGVRTVVLTHRDAFEYNDVWIQTITGD